MKKGKRRSPYLDEIFPKFDLTVLYFGQLLLYKYRHAKIIFFASAEGLVVLNKISYLRLIVT